jgi:hypothetical protein
MKDIVRDRKTIRLEKSGKEDDGDDQHLRVLDDAESRPTDEEEDEPW